MSGTRVYLSFAVAVWVLAGCALLLPAGNSVRSGDFSPHDRDDVAAENNQPTDEQPEWSHDWVGPMPPDYRASSDYSAPPRVFGGDCDAVFTEAELTATLGGSMTRMYSSADPVWGLQYALLGGREFDVLGGLGCAWSGDAGYVWVTLLPEGAAFYEMTPSCDSGMQGTLGCDLEASSNGIQLSGIVAAAWEGPPITSAMQSELVQLFRDHATPQMAVLASALPAGSWSVPADCDAIVAAADFSSIAGLGAGVDGIESGGFGGCVSPALNALWQAHDPTRVEGIQGSCAISTSETSVNFTVSQGTRWRGELTLDGYPAAKIDVPGVEQVWVQTYTDVTHAYVFDGPNWMHLQLPAGMDAGGVAQQLVHVLNGMVIP